MGGLVTKLLFPDRQELRIKNSVRKRSFFRRPSSSNGRVSKLSSAGVNPSNRLPAIGQTESVEDGKARTSKTMKSVEESEGPTFGVGFKGSKKRVDVTDPFESDSGSFKKTEPIFGGCIGDLVDENGVNQFVRWTVEAVASTGAGVRTDALYRASGGHEGISVLAAQGKEGMQDIMMQETNVHVLTGALKLFFRNLKEPILHIEHFQEVLEANPEDVDMSKLLYKIIDDNLSREEKATLAFLLMHLSSVLQYPENNMSVAAMGVVFGPTLMRPGNDDHNIQADMKRMDKLVQLLLTHCHSVFGPRRPSRLPRSSNKCGDGSS